MGEVTAEADPAKSWPVAEWEYVGFAERAHTTTPIDTYRLRVPGGWLYRVDYLAPVYVPSTMTFVPDAR